MNKQTQYVIIGIGIAVLAIGSLLAFVVVPKGTPGANTAITDTSVSNTNVPILSMSQNFTSSSGVIYGIDMNSMPEIDQSAQASGLVNHDGKQWWVLFYYVKTTGNSNGDQFVIIGSDGTRQPVLALSNSLGPVKESEFPNGEKPKYIALQIGGNDVVWWDIDTLKSQTTAIASPSTSPTQTIQSTTQPILLIQTDKSVYASGDVLNLSINTQTSQTVSMTMQFHNGTLIQPLSIVTDQSGIGISSLVLPKSYGHGSIQIDIIGNISGVENSEKTVSIVMNQAIQPISVLLSTSKTSYSAPDTLVVLVQTSPVTSGLRIPIHLENTFQTFFVITGNDGTAQFSDSVVGLNDGILSIDANDPANSITSNTVGINIDNSKYRQCEVYGKCSTTSSYAIPTPQNNVTLTGQSQSTTPSSVQGSDATGTVQTDKQSYTVAVGQTLYAKVSGQVSDALSYKTISVTFTSPDGTKQDTTTIVANNGLFNTYYSIDHTMPPGMYGVDVSYDGIHEAGSSFTVVQAP